MSLINEALRRALIEKDQNKQDPVIRIPRPERQIRYLQIAFFLTVPVILLISAIFLRAETRSRLRDREALSDQIQAISDRQDDIAKRFYSNNEHLDARIQLDLFDLRTKFNKLSSRLGALSEDDMDAFKMQTLTGQKELKDELFAVNKRFHDVTHDNSILAQRLEALEKNTSTSNNTKTAVNSND